MRNAKFYLTPFRIPRFTLCFWRMNFRKIKGVELVARMRHMALLERPNNYEFMAVRAEIMRRGLQSEFSATERERIAEFARQFSDGERVMFPLSA